MKELENVPCTKQVLICTNDRPGEKPCCSRYGGMEFFKKFKEKMKATGLNKTIWVTRTGCLGYCNDVGTTVAIHQAGKTHRWISEVKDADFDRVWEEVVKP